MSSLQRLLLVLVLLLAACAQPGAPAPHAPPGLPQRIISLDYCADQFVLKLADRDQIAAVSSDADADFSFMRAAAAGIPQARGRAEDVLALKPDLVVRSYGGGPNVAALMQRAGVPMAQLGFAEEFAGVRANIRAMAQAVGHPERGEAVIAEMDARLAAITLTPTDLSALYMTPVGVTTGEGSLMHELITAAGLKNFETQPGWRPIPLERLARERPDLVAAAFFDSRLSRSDPWSPARHPVAKRQAQDLPVSRLDGAWTACGGWFLVEAVEALAHTRATIEAAR